MAETTTVLIGTFDLPDEAERAVDELRSVGFSDDHMLLLAREEEAAPRGVPVSSVEQSGTVELANLLSQWGLDQEVTGRIVRNVTTSRALVVTRPGARQQDAARVFKDFGAQIFGNISPADYEAFAATTGYDTAVGTRATIPGGQNIPTDQLGAVTGEERSWQELHPRYRQEWQRRTGGSAQQWQQVEPGYRYAHEMRQEPGYQRTVFAAAEPQLKASYPTWAQQRGYPCGRNQQENEGIWQELKGAVEDAWDRITFKEGPVSEANPVRPEGQGEDQVVMRSRWVRLVPQPRTRTQPPVQMDHPDSERPRVVEREMP